MTTGHISSNTSTLSNLAIVLYRAADGGKILLNEFQKRLNTRVASSAKLPKNTEAGNKLDTKSDSISGPKLQGLNLITISSVEFPLFPNRLNPNNVRAFKEAV